MYTTEPWLKQYLKDIILSRLIWWLILPVLQYIYKRAFEPRETDRHRIPDGKSIINAELKTGDSIVFCQMSSAMAAAFRVKPIGGIAVTLHITLRM